MVDFKLLSYSAGVGAAPHAAILVGDRVIDTAEALTSAGLTDPGSVLSLLRQWDKALPALENLATTATGGKKLDGLRLEAPIQFPGAVYCCAANYYDHFKEMAPDQEFKKEGKSCYFFLKPGAQASAAPNDPIRLPKVSKTVDWEIELGVVIGRKARNLSVANAMECVAGYTIVNDLSARDLGRRADWPNFGVDWFAHKVFDSSLPTGPWIVPANQVADPYKMTMKLTLNDTVMQNSVAGQMIFNIAEQIEYLSRRLTLMPGDIIATGTPAGVGRPRGIFLKPGDTVTLEIGGIGSMHSNVVQGD